MDGILFLRKERKQKKKKKAEMFAKNTFSLL